VFCAVIMTLTLFSCKNPSIDTRNYSSLFWFATGRQSLPHRRPDAAIFWQAIAVIIALILCGWTIAEREWVGLGAGVITVYCGQEYSCHC
jgi:hypothetical protein